MAKKKKKEEKVSFKEALKRLEICNSKIKKLRKWYKTKDGLMKQVLPKFFEEGKYDKENDRYVVKKNGKTYSITPNIYDVKGEYIGTIFKSVGFETFIFEVEGD